MTSFHQPDRECRIARRFVSDPSRRPVRLLAAFVLMATGVLLGASSSAEETEGSGPPALPWQQGSGAAPIGDDLAEIDLDEGYVYLDADGTRRLMELTQNPVDGSEVATVAPAREGSDWFIVFEWSEMGYVADEEKDDLDPDAMLEAIRAGTEAANEERRARGWPEMTIVGWQEEPHYDHYTNDLRWAIIGESNGHRNVNRMVKVLGRRGVMTATLVASPEGLADAMQEADALMEGYRYRPGQTYAEYVPGTDKLAEYGLTALVVGGGAAALLKTGLLAKLWKPIAAALVALAAGVRRFFFSGTSADHDPEKPIG